MATIETTESGVFLGTTCEEGDILEVTEHQAKVLIRRNRAVEVTAENIKNTPSKAELLGTLDALGIQYPKNANKAELQKLVDESTGGSDGPEADPTGL